MPPRWFACLCLPIVLLVMVVGCTPSPADLPPNATAAVAQAREVLPDLPVRSRDPFTGYDRTDFGSGWADLDGDGCNTREEVLRRDLLETRIRDGCKVEAGILVDPYSGRTIEFQRGAQTSAEVQIDHVVALANAWQTGARDWTAQQRLAFANDPIGLLAVEGDANQDKGSGDTATWLPPNRDFRCQYVAMQVLVKHKHELWVTPAEERAMRGVLNRC